MMKFYFVVDCQDEWFATCTDEAEALDYADRLGGYILKSEDGWLYDREGNYFYREEWEESEVA